METHGQRIRIALLLSLTGILLAILALAASGGPSVDQEELELEIYFFVEGNLKNEEGLQPVVIEIRRTINFIDMVCNVRQAATKDTLRVDVQKEGIDIFQGNDVVIPLGQTRSISGTPVLTTGTNTERLRLNVKTTSNARDLSCQLRYSL